MAFHPGFCSHSWAIKRPIQSTLDFIAVSGYRSTIGNVVYKFGDIKTLLGKASPGRSGDDLAGLSASSAEERVAAQIALSDIPLRALLTEPVVPYESDEVTRLIADEHDSGAFAPVAHLTVGDFRDWLLSERATGEILATLATGLTPEMAAAVSKIMRLQDLPTIRKASPPASLMAYCMAAATR